MMFDATSPSDGEPVSAPKARVEVAGRADVSFACRGGRTRVGRNFSSDPLRLLFPRPEPGQPLTGVVVTTSGGLVGGDRLNVSVSADRDSEALVMTQAAEKVYRSAGPDAEIDVTLEAEAGSWLEWLPHETIIFDGARLKRRTRVDLSPDARLLAGEFLVFGRLASGETLKFGYLRDSWEVRRDGRLVWADIFEVDGDWDTVTQAPAGLAGARAFATIICATDQPETARDEIRQITMALQDNGLRSGVTTIAGLTVVRLIGADARYLRYAYGLIWGRIRTISGGFSETLPRLWHI